MDNELPKVRKNAREFATKWLAAAGDEKQETQRFWMELLHSVFGVENPADTIRFEVKVDLSHQRYIDAHIPGTRVVIEQKSADIDLSVAKKQSDGAVLTPYEQAKRYADALPFDDRARWIVTCNFREFRIHDMSRRKPAEPAAIISLEELPEQHHLLAFLVDDQRVRVEKEKHVSMQAGELISRIYNALLEHSMDKDSAATLQSLNKFCVRLVFCLYAEDAGLFKRDQFLTFISAAHSPADLRKRLLDLFVALNRPVERRDPYDTELLAFPYVNGGLFADEDMFIPMMDESIRDLIEKKASADFNWKDISPTIFGGLFESTLNPETRRSGGMHYTSVENIHKVIDPLFMDALHGEFETIRGSDKGAKTRKQQLLDLQDKIAGLTFLDPACGSGNFLTETFISLRRLENEILEEITRLESDQKQEKMLLVKVDIRQFHGIEINDFAVSVAKAALWIADAQMWEATREILHNPSAFLPLKHYDGIREGNALRMDWLDGVPGRHVDYITGNPPFVGHQWRTHEQAADMDLVFKGHDKYGKLDYVCAWFRKAADYMQGASIRTAFVATNSISQGESVACMWKPLFEQGFSIDFAYRTFKWTNEAKNTAAVHCVIVGFRCGEEALRKMLVDEQGETRSVPHINGYLVDAPDVFILNRSKALTPGMPKMSKGSQPTDGGNLILSTEEREEIVVQYPHAADFIRPYIGASELISGKQRWCLWLVGVAPSMYRSISSIVERIRQVALFRQSSPTASVRRDAETPALFTQIRQPLSNYIALPEVSSERRGIIPMAFLTPGTVCSNLLQLIPDATLYHFGVLVSRMHMSWTNAVCGRLKSDYRYTPAVYNNYPWPQPTDEQKAQIEASAQGVLDARAQYPDCSLADLYDPLTMPPELRKAHKALDAAVDKAYGKKFKDDAARVAHLFELYKELVK